MTTRKITLSVDVDAAGAIRDIRGVSSAANDAAGGMDRASGSSRTLTQRLDGLGREASQVAGRVGAVLGTAIAGAGIAAIKLGIDAEETAAKFETVFRGSVESTRQALEDLSATVPLTTQQLEEAASSVQDLLVPLGLARDEAAGLSVEAVSLAGDLASFNNVETQTVIEGIQSALAGSSEPLRRYGIDVRESRLQTLAYEQGIADLGEELTAGQRGQAVFAAIAADSADAIGDLARTTGSTANQFRLLSRDVRQSGEDVGEALLPAVNKVLTELRGVNGEIGPLTELIGDLTVGFLRLAEFTITAAGAFQELGLRLGQVLAVGDRLVNATKNNFGISDLFVPFKAVKSAIDSFNDTVDDAGAISEAAAEDVDELRRKTGDLVAPLIAARLEFEKNRKGQSENNDETREGTSLVQLLRTAVLEGAAAYEESNQALADNGEALVEAKDKVFDFRSEIGRLNAELAGASSVAVFEYNQQIEEFRELLDAGAISQAEFNELIEITAQLFARDQVQGFRKATEEARRYGLEIRQLAFDSLPGFIQEIESVRNVLGIGTDSGGDESTFFDNLAETLGSSISGSLQNGRSLGDSIGTSLVEFGSEPISDAISEVFSKAFEGLESNPQLQDALGGFSVVVGEAIQGNTEQAIGAAAGAIIGSFIPGIGTALGATLGSALGGLFGGGSTPKFQIAGLDGVGSQDLGDRELLNTAIGDFSVAFRGIEADAAREVENLLIDFGQSIAGVVRDSDPNNVIQEAIRDVTFSSRSDGESAGAIIGAIFSEIVASLENGVRQFVERGRNEAERLDRFAALFTINRDLAVGFGLGLGGGAGSIFGTGGAGAGIGAPGPGPGPGPEIPPGFLAPEGGGSTQAVQTLVGALIEIENGSDNVADSLLSTVELLEENRIGNESLLETYSRLIQGLDGLDQAARLTGNSIADTREQAVGFASDLLQFFGDDAAALNASLSTIFDTFFTQEQNALQAIESANERATDLLARIGVDATDAILSQDGFADLFSQLFGTLDPESTAILINAGNEIARLIAAEGDLAAARGESAAGELDLQQIRRETAAIVSPTRAAFDELSNALRDNNAAAGQLADTEEALTVVRENAIARLGAFLFDATESLLENTLAILERDQESTNQQIQNIRRVGQASENRYREEVSALDAIADLVDNLRIGSLSPFAPLDREDEARRQLDELFAAADGGDIDALQDLPGAVQAFLQILQNNTGGVGRFPAEFEAVLARLEAIQDAGPSTRPPTAVDIQQIQQTNQAGFQTVDDNLSELRESLEALREEQQNLEVLEQFRIIAGTLNESPSELAARLGVPLEDLILAITGELPDLTGEALEGFFDELVASTEGTNSELEALETIGIETNEILEQVRDLLADIASNTTLLPDEGDQQAGPAPTPPPFAEGGFASGIVRTGENGPELILPNDVSRFFQRVGVPVNVGGGGDNRATVELLAQILQATERNGGGQANVADSLTAVANEIRRNSDKIQRAEIVGEAGRGGGNCGGF